MRVDVDAPHTIDHTMRLDFDPPVKGLFGRNLDHNLEDARLDLR